jgi:hypothetical protein
MILMKEVRFYGWLFDFLTFENYGYIYISKPFLWSFEDHGYES